MRREVLRLQQVALQQWLIEEPQWGKEWVDAAAESDHLLELTAAELRSFKEDYLALVGRYRTRPDDGAAP